MGFFVESENVARVSFEVTRRNCFEEVERRAMVSGRFTREEFEEMVSEVRHAFEQC